MTTNIQEKYIVSLRHDVNRKSNEKFLRNNARFQIDKELVLFL